ncbi:hypothetical protein FGSG_00782 [Fusarium graminearum PH-1]|uniref:Chromosome 1, complete genome n=1 Tax=Gibberella zeae (strain ATCC MYA-4620 / CBS 123657 / FGSC 9075 / NRRL 31084 / PH-1) TaxID=229533 RepID=I1RB75_GIBZE|nr:hypothetical protein FGSG_00782 [Fusarium graminearum PH-1]ESU06008.1 hypothetical protein FGSG_00782 [Fusarium graminearum PH-1]CEF72782.1 unnamed protein product [Fusarium graminearum]|eukprot:XP_011316493.1 hypothetical protein FGSG_00782 [Fusarium graminearum PH-1]
MGFRSSLRSLFSERFSLAMKDSDHEKQKQKQNQKKHSRRSKKYSQQTPCHCKARNNYNLGTRGQQQGNYYYKSQGQGQIQNQSQEVRQASGGLTQARRVNRPDLEKPLPVVPRQRPPQHQSPYRTPIPLQQDGRQVQKPASAPDEILYPFALADRTGSNEAIIILDNRSMNYEAVCEVIDMIALRFSHIPYAVSGMAAMVYYGYDARPYKVSMLCPEHTRENQKCWAKALGMLPIPKRHDIWGVSTSDGMLRQIRVRFPYDFEEMHVLKVGNSAVSMLSLAGLADELARTYVNELKHSDQDRQENLANEMVWILNRIIQCRMTEHMLRPERIPHLIQERFWVPFSLAYPEVVPLFAKAGWRIPDDELY